MDRSWKGLDKKRGKTTDNSKLVQQIKDLQEEIKVQEAYIKSHKECLDMYIDLSQKFIYGSDNDISTNSVLFKYGQESVIKHITKMSSQEVLDKQKRRLTELNKKLKE